ncbi:MAG: hypothetical protein ABR575_05375 [Actinomycetota bacterium]
MLFGLGLAEWLTIIGVVGGLILTFRVMARASVAYEEKARRRREQQTEDRTEQATREDQR